MKKLYLVFAVLLYFALTSGSVYAESREIIAEGSYQMGDNDTPSIAESRALLKAKRNALEQAGTFVVSSTGAKNSQVTDDKVLTLSAGAMKVTILDTKRTQIGNGMEVKVKIQAIVDTAKLDELIKNIGTQKNSTVAPPESQIKQAPSDTGNLRFNGLYQGSSYHGNSMYYYYYYRFFPDGTVSSYSSFQKDPVTEVFRALASSPNGSGKYSIQDGEIKFSLVFPKGNIDYKGTIDGDKLRLNFHSYIINTDGGYSCNFIEMN